MKLTEKQKELLDMDPKAWVLSHPRIGFVVKRIADLQKLARDAQQVCDERDALRKQLAEAERVNAAFSVALEAETADMPRDAAEHVALSFVRNASLAPSGQAIAAELLELGEMLVAKNRAYGDSALNPVRVFARDLPSDAQILVRLDDKLSRLARGNGEESEDVIADIMGYLVLLRIARKRAADGDADTGASK